MKINISFSSFFSNVQEAPWYVEFLEPVVSQIPPFTKVLDIGTGSGKLLQLLLNEKNSDCTGIDTSESMLAEAEKKLKGIAVSLVQVTSGAAFPFQNAGFDEICICNVLFNLSFDESEFFTESVIRCIEG
jgi:ubiquinone/menaquinone biosynthesis C-methylase UbiE